MSEMQAGGTTTVTERAARVVSGLTLPERIRLVSGADFWNTEAVPGQVPSVMMTDGPHGIRKQRGSADHVGINDSEPATCFPTMVTLASSWDLRLAEEVGAALGAEARAQQVALLLGPGLNIKRHPLGGRNFEYASEDPLLAGRIAAAVVRGVQSEGVGACLKHFAVNNQETRRMVVDALVDERTLREVYLRGFEIALAESSPAAVMTAYNRVNGEYCSEHAALLAGILRGEWGFEGLTVSDWLGTNDRIESLGQGLDLEMPGGPGVFDAEVADAVRGGRIAAADLDRAATRVLALALDHPADSTAVADLEAHHALARKAAAAGTVLLSNDGLLPLPPEGRVAVVGAFATQPRYQGAGSSKVHPVRLEPLLPALRTALEGRGEVVHAPGYDPDTGSTTTALVQAAAKIAADADVVVLVVGIPESAEAEGIDRADPALPEGMVRLLHAVVDANPRTVVVLMNGAPIEMPWWARPAALLEAYLGGEAGGPALADVLLGVQEPGGRLAESFPVEVADLAADANFPGSPAQVQYRETFHVGYRFHDAAGVAPRFPFGHGLGYTTFAWGDPVVSGAGTDLTVSVEVTNTGERPGSAVVQVYVAAPSSAVPRPPQELGGFAKTQLDPGETSTAAIVLDRRAFAVWDPAARDWLVEDGEYEIRVAASSADVRGRAVVRVDSDDRIAALPGTAAAVATDAEFAALLGGRIPLPRPVRPFVRSSALGDLVATAPGRALVAGVEWVSRRQFDPADFDADQEIVAAVLRGMPVRALAQLGTGISLGTVDRVLTVLNGRWSQVVSRTRRRAARDTWPQH